MLGHLETLDEIKPAPQIEPALQIGFPDVFGRNSQSASIDVTAVNAHDILTTELTPCGQPGSLGATNIQNAPHGQDSMENACDDFRGAE